MRVAILNRLPLPVGGDQVLLRELMPALQRAGVQVEHVWGEFMAERLKAFNLAHVFHLDFNFCRSNYSAVKVAGIPYVITPIHYPEFWEMLPAEKLAALRGARCVMPFTSAEAGEIVGRFGNGFPMQPIPSGTAERFHGEASPDRVGVCASDWGRNKNTETIARACGALGIPFTRFQNVSDDDLAAEYRKYKVFATATPSDRMSLAVGEALCSGCRVLASTANRGNEWYPGIQTISPFAFASEWMSRLHAAYHDPGWDWTPNEAARRLTWDGMAAQVAEVYRSALA
jgi:hypothetical protein